MFLLRGFIYLLCVAGVAQIISLEAFDLGPMAEYSEDSLTETLQDAFAAVSAGLFFYAAYMSVKFRYAGILLGALMSMMFVREADSFLDQNVFDGAWQAIVFAILVVTLFSLRGKFKAAYQSLKEYSMTASFGLMSAGVVIILAFSRLMGRGKLWQALMDDAYMRAVKNLVEEGTELLGYTIVVLAAVEFVVYVLNQNKRNASLASS
ncbi:hypothetical protein [Marinomonas mediterranea]|jgi:hypothetical protein|uniref:Uncharacterized protein n=1 Tax=Marinomonas mediterranea (strain ATCC 700492 / JCM 21426 / NBRC 103028 / MMB-1) TaxID=717774 RepID=F2JUR3_MARM1|nr:hypothetical protein [Marinomonas mediterranea]ADZ90478.1 hypothetical protein Marme_1205 [Marinomonas mediterranea MMB-1]WCN08533.1 hypothetical protein GV055_06130 [Marinomonas mediterranea]WCN12587.1 hypothetical protein GV054_05970 [Marinomonas mediterranea]WCN16658.1 hypothetical protein GV053_06100 [Marinomonas mediterranea MMB-1]